MGFRPLGADMLRAARRLAAAADAALLPRCCVFCGVRCLPGEPGCCRGCRADLPWIGAQCAGCAEPLEQPAPPGVRCGACQQHPRGFVIACAPLYYRFPVDAAIRALKFHRRLEYAPALAALLMPALPRLPGDVDALLPVPLYWRRQAGRGFNQAAELCRPLQRHTGWPLLHQVQRIRHTGYQSELPAAARRRNLRAAFAATDSVTARHVLIVDEVMTTGTTCRELAAVLHAAGAGKVSVLAVARASTAR
jgi:ComF family protein